jgi:hypothetical protein
VQWIPGYWAWDNDRNDFVWVSGIWRAEPPDRQWVPGHWDQMNGGWQWTPGFWTVQQQNQVEYLPEPPAPPEAVASTPAPDANSVYVPGNWVFRDTRYVWRAGYWVNYRPGWIWIPAHYVWTPAGYVYVEGYWDYQLDRRGLLFAPVYFTQRLWTRPSWFFQPTYCVEPQTLLTALFIRRGFPSYYFGDYFEPAYRRSGFVSWIDYRYNRVGYDPLYSYYRWRHRDNPDWDRGLRTLYAARVSGEIARPPRTLVQQTTLIQNITNNGVNVQNIQNVTVLAPMNRMHDRVVRLQAVPQQERQADRQHAEQLRQLSLQRATQERQLVAKGKPVARADTPRVVKLDLPRTAPTRPEHRVQPPAPPVAPHNLTTGSRPEAPRKPRAEPGTGPNVQPRVEPRVEPRTQPRVEPRTEPKAQPRAEPRPEPRPQPRAQPQPEHKPAPQQAQPRPEVKPPPKVEARPEHKPAPKPPQPQAKPAPAPKQEHKGEPKH